MCKCQQETLTPESKRRNRRRRISAFALRSMECNLPSHSVIPCGTNGALTNSNRAIRSAAQRIYEIQLQSRDSNRSTTMTGVRDPICEFWREIRPSGNASDSGAPIARFEIGMLSIANETNARALRPERSAFTGALSIPWHRLTHLALGLNTHGC